MFSSDRNIETLSQLIIELKRYAELRGKSLQISFVSKLTQLMAALIVGAALFLLAAIALLFVSMMAATALAPHVGGQATGYALIAALYLFLGILIYSKRRTWIESPIANFLGHLFLDDEDSAKH